MARIIASGTPVKHPELGEIRIIVDGDEVEIENIEFQSRRNDKWEKASQFEKLFNEDLKEGPSYPLCADPFTMRCALFVLFEWFGEAESCWIEEPKHVKLEGEIEPMESVPGRIY